ncbi:response regulator [Capnocytophaga canis]|uniref:Response regulator receiver domain protein n=1 Tax=Capnocytophaga canis TaxID=1848903 RepID=A0A0B7I2V0_9FLAO|nr:response regulator [Capnocytophaga canis]CEN44432.1 Response regulator receiver domain protein [Capnocytophaga canis]
MIYLIDEQVFRQETYGWNIEKLNEYQGIISTHKDSKKLSIENIKKEKIVFLHESFPNEGLKNQLYEHNAQNRDFGLVVFSGSKNERRKNATGNRVDLPVSVFYKNLEIFLQEIKKGNKPNVNYLLYGRNPEEEKIIIDEIDKRNNEVDADPIVAKKENIIFLTAEKYIEDPFSNMESETLFSEKKVFSDSFLHRDVVLHFLNDKVFDNLYIPLCFGNTLSDLNGLRLAAHIRCTPTPNQLKNIFIYGVVPYEKLIQNPYFDILKTKNVFYIDYSIKALQEAEKRVTEPFLQSELANEIRKIQLVAPKDNHSIANEWAIYRWAKTIESSDNDIEKINAKIESDLYYKYLKTIYPISATDTSLQNLEIQIPQDEKPKILYIDDESKKGWSEIFETILCHNSKIEQFDYLDIDFSQNREEIVNQAVQKIKADDIDIVILDFRLHHSDFENNDLKGNTSIRILQEIKKYNQGIQVIYFSATNKIWNLQKLQALGADGFIIKEAPENSIDPQFTADTIGNFKEVMETAVKRKFLKIIFLICKQIKKNIENQIALNPFEEYNKFLKILITQIKIIEQAISKIDLKVKMSMDIVFLSAYNFLEHFKNYYFKYDNKDYRYYIGEKKEDVNNYYFDRQNKFIKNKDVIKDLTWFCAMANLFIDYFEICSQEDKKVEYLNKVKDKRNNYIHEDKSFFDEKEVIMVLSLCENITSKLKP